RIAPPIEIGSPVTRTRVDAVPNRHGGRRSGLTAGELFALPAGLCPLLNRDVITPDPSQTQRPFPAPPARPHPSLSPPPPHPPPPAARQNLLPFLVASSCRNGISPISTPGWMIRG